MGASPHGADDLAGGSKHWADMHGDSAASRGRVVCEAVLDWGILGRRTVVDSASASVRNGGLFTAARVSDRVGSVVGNVGMRELIAGVCYRVCGDGLSGVLVRSAGGEDIVARGDTGVDARGRAGTGSNAGDSGQHGGGGVHGG